MPPAGVNFMSFFIDHPVSPLAFAPWSPRFGLTISCPWRSFSIRSRTRRQCHNLTSYSLLLSFRSSMPPLRPSWTRPAFRPLSGMVPWYKKPYSPVSHCL